MSRKKSVPVFGTTIKEILADNILDEAAKSVLFDSRVRGSVCVDKKCEIQPKILHGDYYGLYNEEREMYMIHDKNKLIGYTNCNRFVMYTGVPSSAGKNTLNINLVDMRSMLELCEICTKSLYS